jgi:hypothetical protein
MKDNQLHGCRTQDSLTKSRVVEVWRNGANIDQKNFSAADWTEINALRKKYNSVHSDTITIHDWNRNNTNIKAKRTPKTGKA